jgi:enhancing lycopene biosynthesis protein 2
VVEQAIVQTVSAGKPLGALCISPALIARVLKNAEVTIGDDKATTAAVEAMGAAHIKTTHGEIVVDPKFRLVTTPCYMLDATISQIADGANNVVAKILEMA